VEKTERFSEGVSRCTASIASVTALNEERAAPAPEVSRLAALATSGMR
jgi:hypothetical protein